MSGENYLSQNPTLKTMEEDPVLQENDSTGELHKDTHEDSKTSLDDLTIYLFQGILFTIIRSKMVKRD